MKELKPTVLFIGGYGRMGSTLLDRLIGQHPNAFSGGEIRHFWDRGIRDEQLCECKRPLSSCEFWSVVIEREFGGLETLRKQRPWDLWASVDRLGTVPRVIRRSVASDERIARYVDMVGRVIRRAASESGAAVVIDSSKYPVHGMLLGLVPDIDLRIVHLVRDSRAVAFSWQRTKHRPEIYWETSYIRKRSVFESSVAWTASSLLIEANRRLDVPQITLRYEDFMRWPTRTLKLLWRFTGLEPVTGVVEDRVAQITNGHTIAGNPSRFESGEVTLRSDNEWMRQLSPRQKALISTVTLPGLLMYGYSVSPGRHEGEPPRALDSSARKS